MCSRPRLRRDETLLQDRPVAARYICAPRRVIRGVLSRVIDRYPRRVAAYCTLHGRGEIFASAVLYCLLARCELDGYKYAILHTDLRNVIGERLCV